MQFWQQIGKGLDFLSGFQSCFSGTFQTQKNDGTRYGHNQSLRFDFR